MRLVSFCLVSLLAFQSPGVAQAHDDVLPYNSGGKIVAGGHDDDANTTTPSERVFGYDFGENPSFPYRAGDPGFNNGSGFTLGLGDDNGRLAAGQNLTFDIASNLQYWDGTTTAFGIPSPSGVVIKFNDPFGGDLTQVGTGSHTGSAPYLIGTSSGTGRIHQHLGARVLETLNGSEGGPDGFYILGIVLKMNTLTDSEPIYMVYNLNMQEEMHDGLMDLMADNLANGRALDFNLATLVPEPSSLALAVSAILGVAGLGRRMRRGATSECAPRLRVPLSEVGESGN